MTTLAAIHASLRGDNALALRPADQVMNLERLGALHQSRLSFMRALVRRIMRERWQIETRRFDLDEQGYGTVIYQVQAPHGLFNFVIFSDYLSDEERNDRVIATKWDLTMALVDGEVDGKHALRFPGKPPYITASQTNKQEQRRGDKIVVGNGPGDIQTSV